MSPAEASLTPLAAFDVRADGTAETANGTDVVPPDGFAYRWLHLSLADPALAEWAGAHLPPLARRALLADRTRPRMDLGDDGLSVTLRGINLNPGEESADMVSLRIWIGDRLIVTVRRQRVFAVEEERDRVEANDAPHSPGHLLVRITEGLVERVEQIAFDREDMADDMEDDVYEDDRQPGTDLVALRREIIKLRRHVLPLAETLEQIAVAETPLLAEDLRGRMRDTASHCKWALEELHEVDDRLDAMADHLEGVADARQEKNSFRLSIVAAVFLPISFMTGLFGVNVGGMPGINHPMAFWYLCGGMLVVAVVSAIVMRLLRWF